MTGGDRPRLLLLIPSSSYRTRDFLAAAHALGAHVVVGSDRCIEIGGCEGHGALQIVFRPESEGVCRILDFAHRYPLSAIIATDDETSVLAALASRALGLAHNEPESVATARDKHRFRQRLAAAGLRSPWFEPIALDADVESSLARLRYPCVLKPLQLAASQGVIRVDTRREAADACRRIERILSAKSGLLSRRERRTLLAEGFIEGREVALDGLMSRGRLQVLAVFDKPDPLDGPFFEETLYLTPSSLPHDEQRDVAQQVEQAAHALGLTHGALHAELRLSHSGACLVELAPRSIGGLCSRTLTFVPDKSLEEVIVRHALGLETHNLTRETHPCGVMMIPIPRAGRLLSVAGIEEARAIAGIEDVVISIGDGETVVPLPEGDRYLGFIFARGEERCDVEGALRAAHARLRFDITEST